MAAHKGSASSRPRCTRSGSSVATIPVYPGPQGRHCANGGRGEGGKEEVISQHVIGAQRGHRGAIPQLSNSALHWGGWVGRYVLATSTTQKTPDTHGTGGGVGLGLVWMDVERNSSTHTRV
jgi:hypothetical protein